MRRALKAKTQQGTTKSQVTREMSKIQHPCCLHYKKDLKKGFTNGPHSTSFLGTLPSYTTCLYTAVLPF